MSKEIYIIEEGEYLMKIGSERRLIKVGKRLGEIYIDSFVVKRYSNIIS